jgi:hypothetical protein
MNPLLAVTDSHAVIDTHAINDWIAQANQALIRLPTFIDQVDWRVAIVLTCLGILSLLYGFKIFKAVITLYCAVVGASLGWWIAAQWLHQPAYWWVGALVGGAVLALVAWPLVNFFVGFWGAVAGGLLGYALARATGDPTVIWIAVLAGVVVCAILAIILLRLMIIVTTSVVGSYMLVVGAIVLLSLIDGVTKPLHQALNSKHYILPLVIFVPALLGVVLQLYQSEPGTKGGQGAKKSSGDQESDED